MLDDYREALAFLTAIGIGLLVGLERERHAETKAGVRTFALIGLLGALSGLLGEAAGAAWIAAALLPVAVAPVLAAYALAPKAAPDGGTTTVVAAAVVFGLGAASWQGHAGLAVGLAIIVTVLLHYKSEIEGFSQELTKRDIASVLQFAVLAVVILPVVPDRGFGPLEAFNPFHIATMVVLISAVGLAGYILWRLFGERVDAAIIGALGGLVSSTATTLVYSREARAAPRALHAAVVVILLANLVVLVRLAVLSVAAAPELLPRLGAILGAGLAAGAPFAWLAWRKGHERGALKSPEYTNPANLRVALGFGVLYALILFAAEWLREKAGVTGVYALAFVSGLTDVDAIALSSMRLYSDGRSTPAEAVTTIVVAVVANLIVKAGIAFFAGGAALGKRCLAGFAAMAAGLVAAALFLP